MFEINLSRRRFLRGTAMTIAAAHLGSLASAKTYGGRELASLAQATEWLNSQPLAAEELQGKIALINFWTYTCINWRRQLPYVRAWAERYKDQGLVVIGVHSPEFSFEKNLDNVRWAVKDMNIAYPVAVDSDHAIWRGFNNEYWPALYFVNSNGHISHQVFGEGQYEESELVIQKLFEKSGATGGDNQPVVFDPQGAEVAADWKDLQSEENYLGYERTRNDASKGGAIPGKPHSYSTPQHLELNSWGLSGNWTVGSESVTSNEPGCRIAYRFHARDLHLVTGPQTAGTRVRFRLFLDGQAPLNAHGVDVDAQGNGTLTESRMYQLIRQPAPIGDRRFEIEFLDSGAQAFSFTFG